MPDEAPLGFKKVGVAEETNGANRKEEENGRVLGGFKKFGFG